MYVIVCVKERKVMGRENKATGCSRKKGNKIRG
jgi:hypothetical protein